MAQGDPINTSEYDGAACEDCGDDAVDVYRGRPLCAACFYDLRDVQESIDRDLAMDEASDGWQSAARVVLLALVVLCGAGEASAQTWPVIVGNAADLVSTEIVLASMGDRVREGNPILGQHVVQRVAVKAAGTALQVWLVKKLERRSPKAAKIASYSVGIWCGGVTVWNVRQLRR